MTTTAPPPHGPLPAPAPADRPAAHRPAAHRAAGPAPVLDLVVPVLDEERDLAPCVRRLSAHLRDLPFASRITIADNGSTDATAEVATALARELDGVRVVRLAERGRGRALKQVWSASDAQVLAYTDVDLSTDLAALLPLVASLLSGHSDVAIGTRLARGSHVVRGPRREFVSRCYNHLLRRTLRVRFSDAQCGFKAVRADVAHRLLPLVEDPGWFFDTELLVLAERCGMRIHEVPVDWVDDPDSRVDVVATALADLRGMWRLGRALASGRLLLQDLRSRFGRGPALASAGVPAALPAQLLRFGVVGVLSTVAFALLYLALQPVLGAQGANSAALLATALGNTALNRRHTFGVRGRDGALRHHAQGLLVFCLGWALTSGALAALHASGAPGRGVELAVLTGANLLATLLRFLLLRSWVFPARRGHSPGAAVRGRGGAHAAGPQHAPAGGTR